MKIALINEWTNTERNAIAFEELKKQADIYGHTVRNYGMYGEGNETNMNTLHCALLSAILLNSGAVDRVVTGCGNGQGVTVALNAYPGVVCGHVVDPVDAYMFGKVNNGNAIALQFDKQFGWGAELNLEYIFRNFCSIEWGSGYPTELHEGQAWEQNKLKEIKKITHHDMPYILDNIEDEFFNIAVSGKHFQEYFFEDAKDGEIKDIIRKKINA